MAEWFHIAFSRPIVRRALRYAIGIGTLLIVINHGDAILRREWSAARLLRMALTVMVPYCVSTASAVGALRERSRQERASP